MDLGLPRSMLSLLPSDMSRVVALVLSSVTSLTGLTSQEGLQAHAQTLKGPRDNRRVSGQRITTPRHYDDQYYLLSQKPPGL